RHVHVDHRGLPAGLRVVARGSERDALVQGHHVAQLRVVQQRVQDRALGGAGGAEDVPHPVRDEALHEDVLAAHGWTHASASRRTQISRRLGPSNSIRTIRWNSPRASVPSRIGTCTLGPTSALRKCAATWAGESWRYARSGVIVRRTAMMFFAASLSPGATL